MLYKAYLGPAAFGLFILCTSASHAATVAEAAAAVATKTSPDAAKGLRPVTDVDLNNLRGGHVISIANQTLTSIAEGNSISGGVTAGGVNLSDNAFSSFNGLGNIVINTGSQVSVQSGMNITINVSQ